jgi:hypothetical protein
MSIDRSEAGSFNTDLDYALSEGRDRIRNIRDDNDTFRELSLLLSEYGEGLSCGLKASQFRS